MRWPSASVSCGARRGGELARSQNENRGWRHRIVHPTWLADKVPPRSRKQMPTGRSLGKRRPGAAEATPSSLGLARPRRQRGSCPGLCPPAKPVSWGGAGNAAGGACGTPPPWQQGEGPGRAAGILGASSGNFYCQNATFGVMFLTVFYRPGGGSHFSTNFLPPMWLNKKKETRLGLFSLPVATKRCALRAGGGGRGGTPRAARPRGARPAAPAQWGGRRCDRAHVARRAPARPAPPPRLARDGGRGGGVAWAPIKASAGPAARAVGYATGQLAAGRYRRRPLRAPSRPVSRRRPPPARPPPSLRWGSTARASHRRRAACGWVRGTRRRGGPWGERPGPEAAAAVTWAGVGAIRGSAPPSGLPDEGPVPRPSRPLRNGSRQPPEGGGRAPSRRQAGPRRPARLPRGW